MGMEIQFTVKREYTQVEDILLSTRDKELALIE